MNKMESQELSVISKLKKGIHRHRFWLCLGALAWLTTPPAIAADDGETIVANYRQSFNETKNENGQWSFLWNNSSKTSSDDEIASSSAGGITDPQSYQHLTKSGGQWMGPEGICLSPKGGRPGLGAKESGTTYGHYAISAFKVGRAGCYSIGHSYLHKLEATGNDIDVIIHAGSWRPVLRKTCPPGNSIQFDTQIGYLPANSIIYVAVGPGISSKADDFEMDFSICRDDTPSLQEQIDSAKANGLSRVRLVPGRYYTTDTLDISVWKNFDIDAAGVTLIAPPEITAVSVASCAGGKLEGLTIDQDPLPLTQGQVMAIDPQRNWLDLKIDDFYPIPRAGGPVGDRNMIFDATTLDQIRPAASFNIANIERACGDVCRLKFRHSLTPEVGVGDLLSIQTSDGHAAFVIADSEKMKFNSITLYSSAAFSFYEHGGGDNMYENLKLTPGPQHLLASRPRLRTSGADGFHSRDTRIGPKVSDSLFERTGDDGMAIDGPWGVVVENSSANQVYVAVRSDNMFQAGEPLRFFRFANRSQARATVGACAESNDKVAAAQEIVKTHYPDFAGWRDYKHVYQLSLNGLAEPGLGAGDLVSFPNMNGEGFEFRNNVVRGGRSRGIIVKANGIVAGNCIEDCQKPGILVYSAFGHDSMEAQFVENLMISNNVIEDCNFMHPVQATLRYSGGIVVTADVATDRSQWGCDGHRNIQIENNTIRGIYCGVNVTLSDVSNVLVKNNHFLDSHRHPGGSGGDYGVDNKAIIWIDHADGVAIEDCDVNGVGKYGDPGDLVSTTKSASHITGHLRLDSIQRLSARSKLEANFRPDSAH